MIAPYVYDGNMAMMKKNDNKKTRGQKAEAKRMTAMGLSEARARLKEIDKQKAANPGIGFKIPKKEEAQLRKFVSDYGKTKPKRKGGSGKNPKPPMRKMSEQQMINELRRLGKLPKPKMGSKSNVVPTPLSPLFKPKGK